MDNPEVLSLVLHRRLDDLRLLHEAVEAFCAGRGLPRRPVGQLQLALEEHVTNIIRYAGDPNDAAQVTVLAHLEGNELVAEVRDQGPPFNPLELPPPNLHQPIDERPLGGLGVHLMRQLTDRLDYRREGSTNVLTLHKRLASCSRE